jgi:hypothetical protein
MGYDLIKGNTGQSIHWNTYQWPLLLRLAKEYGWKPQGTTKPYWEGEPGEPEWEGGYTSNDQQVVAADDALGLAIALEKALPDIPDHEVSGARGGAVVLEEHIEETLLRELRIAQEAQGNMFAAFSGGSKLRLAEFISFCRSGGFIIS